MSQKEIELLKKALEREKAARKQAELILEEKATELYNKTLELKAANQAQEKLVREKTLQLDGIFKNIVDAYIVVDLWGNVLNINPAATQILEINLDDNDFNLMQLVAKKDIEKAKQSFKTVLKEGAISNLELDIITPNKTKKTVHINASVIYGEDQIPIAVQSIVRDITTQKQAKDKLLESESKLSTIIKSLDSGILFEDEQRNIILANAKFCEFFEIPLKPEKLIGINCANMAQETKHKFKNPEEFAARIENLLQTKKAVIGEKLFMKNGKTLERDFIPIHSNNHYKGQLWNFRDITLKYRYNINLEHQKQKYSNIIANMNLGLIEVNNNDEILFANQSFLNMSGYTLEEVIGQKGSHLFAADNDSQKIISNETFKRTQKESNSYEIKAKNKAGELKYWLISGAPNYNINGEVIGSIGVHLDITPLKKLKFQKEQLLLKLKNSNDKLQEYAHIVSHDLKSPLYNISSLISWIKEDNLKKFTKTDLTYFDRIEETLHKMDQLISNILLYSSLDFNTEELSKINLNHLINDIVQTIYLPKHITLNIITSLPNLTYNKTKLQQVFQNLINNAVKFIDKEKGIIEIGASEEQTHWQFFVKDNGVGIEKKYQDKIFDTFFSLHKNNKSSGIGLSIVQKIIENYNGKIWLESTPKKGTTFYFSLPKN